VEAILEDKVKGAALVAASMLLYGKETTQFLVTISLLYYRDFHDSNTYRYKRYP
jgi:hypothetical protein